MSVWIGGADIVLHGFRSTSNRVVHMVVHHFRIKLLTFLGSTIFYCPQGTVKCFMIISICHELFRSLMRDGNNPYTIETALHLLWIVYRILIIPNLSDLPILYSTLPATSLDTDEIYSSFCETRIQSCIQSAIPWAQEIDFLL